MARDLRSVNVAAMLWAMSFASDVVQLDIWLRTLRPREGSGGDKKRKVGDGAEDASIMMAETW